MSDDIDSLPELTERVRSQAAHYLLTLNMPVPQPLVLSLTGFYQATRDRPSLQEAGEVAQMLAGLLRDCGEEAPKAQDLKQLSFLMDKLLHQLAPEGNSPSGVLPPLVMPVVPSASNNHKRVVLCVDSCALRVVLHETLADAGFEPVNADTPEALLALDARWPPVAIIADLGLCQLYPQCLEIFSSLRQRFNPHPHLFCIGSASDIPARLDAVRLGATRFMAQPIDAGRLVSILKGVTLRTPSQPFRVLLVEDDSCLGEISANGLRKAGLEVCLVDHPLEVPTRISGFEPDVIVSNIYMPGCNGFELLVMLRQDDALADTPIIVLSSEPGGGRRLEALGLGADDFLCKPVDTELLVSAVIARARRARMLKRSRSEYRRVLQRMREMEAYLPEHLRGDAELEVQLEDAFLAESINMDDYVVQEMFDEDTGVSGQRP